MDRGVSGNIFGLYTMNAGAMDVRFEQYTNLEPARTLWRLEVPAATERAV